MSSPIETDPVEPEPKPPSPDVADAANLSLARTVVDAIRGIAHDYTKVPLERAVLLLAVPMVVEMVMESLFALTDVFWVSRLGSDAVAVIGLTESIMSIIYAVAFGIAIAAGAIVARRIGEKDPKRAAHAAGQIIVLGIVTSALLGLVMGYHAETILRLMGADAELAAYGRPFATIMLGGNATVFLIFLINAIFRGAGDPALAMRTLILANGLNIILDPCFIFGVGPFPEMGLTGAAVATNVGRGIGVLYQVWHLTQRPGVIRVHAPDLRPRLASLIEILRTAGNGIAQLLIATTSWVGLYKILAEFGAASLAGYTIAIRVVIFALMPAWGLSNAAATLVGQNLGAKQPDRAARSVRIAMRYNVIFLSLFGAGFVAFSHPIAGVFTDEPEVFAYAAQALWVISLSFPLYAAGMCFEAAFNGAGDTWTPTRVNFIWLWLVQVPLAWVLAMPLDMGPTGVFIAVPGAYTGLTIWSWVLFKRGQWQKHQV